MPITRGSNKSSSTELVATALPPPAASAGVYRHAHALELFRKRQRNIRAALEKIMEPDIYASPSTLANLAPHLKGGAVFVFGARLSRHPWPEAIIPISRLMFSKAIFA
jgi:hypothetical protein